MFFPSLFFFILCDFVVSMLDTEHCVLFDLHVRDRVEIMYEREKEKGN
jgi:hypothetical protein